MRQRPSVRIGGLMVVSLALVAALGGSAAAARSPLGPKDAAGSVALAEAAVSGSFAGKAEGGPQVAVAVVAEQPATEGETRTISLYVCNGSSLSVWLTGTTPGNDVDLKSADGRFGAHVSLTAQRASGKVGLPGGSGFSFAVPPAVGFVGLFDVTLATDGTLQGASTEGAKLSGRLAGKGKLSLNGTLTVTVSLRGTKGSGVKLTVPVRRLRPGAYRWIILPDRTVFGANRKGPAFGGIGDGLGTLRLRPTGTLQPGGKGSVRIKGAGSAGQPGYDDDRCGNLANAYNKLLDISLDAATDALQNGVPDGKNPVSTAAVAAANATLDELDDHCLVVWE